jgi:hypothetical protein
MADFLARVKLRPQRGLSPRWSSLGHVLKSLSKTIGFTYLCFIQVAAFSVSGAEETPKEKAAHVFVKARVKPDRPWKQYKTRDLAHLAGYEPGHRKANRSKYGGWSEKKTRGTGFFSVRKIGDRWWLIDPDGYAFIHVGVCSVRPGKTEANRSALRKRFGTQQKWAGWTIAMLREYGFNGTGAWSDTHLLRSASRPLVYTLKWSFMGSFGREKGLVHQRPGHLGYPNDCMPIFHPEFEPFCKEYAKGLAATKDDPFLLGHFSDNELPAPRNLLDKLLSLNPDDPNLAPGYRAAREWLSQRKGPKATKSDIDDEDRDEFRGFVLNRYSEITTRAMRKYDPHHLMLGSRLHGSEKRSPSVFKAAGKHLDVIAVNYYGVWGPEQETLQNWNMWSGKPVIITEFYTKGADAGLANWSGAGWIVPTQQDRGLFYQHYTLGLLESKVCVGWHWFKYMDNDPSDLTTDPSNRDSNKGIMTIRYRQYDPLLERMRELNQQAYSIIEHFDSSE